MGALDSVRDTGATGRVAVPCPVCNRSFLWPPADRCERCGADLAGELAASVWELDREAAALRERRRLAVQDLRAEAVAAAPVPAVAPRPAAERGASRLRPQVFLAAAGGVLLLAAAAVFIAVTWPTWPPVAQAVFVTLLTVVAAIGARAVARRGLPVTADVLGVVAMGIAATSLQAAHREGLAGLDALDPVLWTSLVAALVAVAARPLATWARLRDTPRRVGAVAAVVAAVAGLGWLVRVGEPTEPTVLLLAAAPLVAVLLLLHGRWVLRRGDPVRLATRVVPAGLLVGAAVATALVPFDVPHALAVLAAAVVGLPSLLWFHRSRPEDLWARAGVVVAALWGVGLATFALTEVVSASLGLDQPRLVTFTLAAVALGVGAQPRVSARWRDPALVALAGAMLPATLWTTAVWLERSRIVVEVLEAPFTGWPSAAALTASDLVVAVGAVAGIALVLHRWRRPLVQPFVLVAGGTVLAVAVVAAAAAGVLATPVPLLVAAAAALAAGAVWARDAGQWRAVAVTELAAVGVALVDLDLFAAATAVVAVHLLVMAGLRSSTAVAATGLGVGLVALGATGEAIGWAVASSALLIAVVAGTAVVVAQLTPGCRPWRATPTDVVALTGLLLATGVAAVEEAATIVAVQLAVLAVAAVVHAARPGRGWAVWLAAAAVSGSIWTLLGDRGIDVVEAYSLPAAAALAAAGAWRLRTADASSWAAFGAACAMASLPTLGLLLQGPDPLRVVLLTIGAVAVALVGHWRRLAAPLAFGAVVAAVTALVQLYDWTAHLPRWVTFGTLGVVLIWTSATYEAQLRRARRVQQHLAALR